MEIEGDIDMTKDQLIRKLAKECFMSVNRARFILNILLEISLEERKNGKPIKIKDTEHYESRRNN